MSPITPSSFVRVVLPVCAGIAAGIVSSLVFAHTASPVTQPVASPTHAAADVPARREDTGSSPRGRDAEIDGRLRAVEAEVAAIAPKPKPRSPPKDPAEREREMRDGLAQQRQRVAQVEAEPVDDAWAHTTETTLRGAMEALAKDTKHAGRIDRVTCRSTGCVATLEFPTFAEAQAGNARYASEAFDVRCAQSVALEMPEESDGAREGRRGVHAVREGLTTEPLCGLRRVAASSAQLLGGAHLVVICRGADPRRVFFSGDDRQLGHADPAHLAAVSFENTVLVGEADAVLEPEANAAHLGRDAAEVAKSQIPDEPPARIGLLLGVGDCLADEPS